MSLKRLLNIAHLRLPVSGLVGGSFGLLLLSLSNIAWGAPAFVWSQLDAPYINVYFSPDGMSSVQLTSRGKNVLPTLDRRNHEIWISWIDKAAPGGDRLDYARLSDTGTVRQKGSLPNTSGKLYAPSVAIEPSGKRVWIVWVENKGRTEDLFVSYLDIDSATSADWAPAIQITASDKFSANLPRIDRVASGKIDISWMRTGPGQRGRSNAMVSTSLFDRNSASARQIKPVDARFDSSNVGLPGVKYITDNADTTEYGMRWKKLTRNKTALMGAAISDSGVVTRIFDRR